MTSASSDTDLPALAGYQAPVFWLTGLSGAGKSTVCSGTADRLTGKGYRLMVLDGDVVRERIRPTAGFSAETIVENNVSIAQMCAEARADADAILVSVISPLEQGRAAVRRFLGDGFYLVYCNADIHTVSRRDVKGLYAKARAGELTDMIGFSRDGVPFEPPRQPSIVLNTASEDPQTSVAQLCAFIEPILRSSRR